MAKAKRQVRKNVSAGVLKIRRIKRDFAPELSLVRLHKTKIRRCRANLAHEQKETTRLRRLLGRMGTKFDLRTVTGREGLKMKQGFEADLAVSQLNQVTLKQQTAESYDSLVNARAMLNKKARK